MEVEVGVEVEDEVEVEVEVEVHLRHLQQVEVEDEAEVVEVRHPHLRHHGLQQVEDCTEVSVMEVEDEEVPERFKSCRNTPSKDLDITALIRNANSRTNGQGVEDTDPVSKIGMKCVKLTDCFAETMRIALGLIPTLIAKTTNCNLLLT